MRVAAVDIGSNTTRLLVAESVPAGLFPRRVEWIDRRSIVTRLGQGVDATRRLAPEAMDRTMATLEAFGAALRSWRCEAARAVATAALRDAENREEFLERAALALGLRPEVVSGDDEAALAFTGTTGGVDADPPYLVVDLGGGSTEFVLGTDAPEQSVSVDIGSVRLTERVLGTRPVSPRDLSAARSHVADLLDREVDLARKPATVVGVGGTFTSLAAIHLGLEVHDAEVVHGAELTRDAIHELTDDLALLSVEATAAIPSLDPARAPVILGGAVVAEMALAHVGPEVVLISERDILDGIALGLGAPGRTTGAQTGAQSG